MREAPWKPTVIAALAALAVFGCAADDPAVDEPTGATAEDEAAVDAPDDDAPDEGEADGDDASDDGADEPPEIVPAEGLQVIFDDVELIATGVRCEPDAVAAGLIEVDMIEVELFSPAGEQGAFRAMWDLDAGHMHRVVVSFQPDPDTFEYETYNVDWREDDVVGEIEFTAEEGTSGELELKADSELAAAARPDGATVVFDVSCDV